MTAPASTSSEVQASPPAPPPPPQEFRFPTDANVPEWARGKTAAEALQVGNAAIEAVRLLSPQPQTQPRPSNGLPTDMDIIQRPVEGTTQLINATLAPHLQAIAQSNAAVARQLAASQYVDDFKRWGPEIDTLMATVPMERRALDAYELVVNTVRGRHVDELATERAKTLVAQGGLERTQGAGFGAPGPVSGGLDLDKLPTGLSDAAKRIGLTTQMVVEWCKSTGQTPEEWMKQAQDQNVLTSTGPFSFTVRDEKLGVGNAFA